MPQSRKAKALGSLVDFKRALAPRVLPKRSKVAPANYPRTLERQYTKVLLDLVAHVEETARSEIQPVLKRAVAAAGGERGDSIRTDDSSAGLIRAAIQRARLRLSFTLPDSKASLIARNMGRSVRRHADQELADQLKKAFGVNVFSLLARVKKKPVKKQDDAEDPDLGVDPFADDPEAEDLLDAFVETNVALIQSIPRNALSQLESLLLSDVTSGKRASDLAADITDRFGVSESRAALIARDQVGKFFGAVTRLRQTTAGIEGYIWSTAGDERVRESHAELEGTVHKWGDPPDVDGEPADPGEPINCRCVATPDVSDFVDEPDDEE